MRKPDFCICENKDAYQFRVTAKLISAFVFATRIVQSLFFLNPKFQASSHLLWLYSPVCVGPGRKPRRPVFSQRGSDGTSVVVLSVTCFNVRFGTVLNLCVCVCVCVCACVCVSVSVCRYYSTNFNLEIHLRKQLLTR